MNDLMNIVKEELERTNGKIEYKEQVHSILSNANVEPCNIDCFIKNVLKKRKEKKSFSVRNYNGFNGRRME